jgi:hypothetical protein
LIGKKEPAAIHQFLTCYRPESVRKQYQIRIHTTGVGCHIINHREKIIMNQDTTIEKILDETKTIAVVGF